jgi:hypothetical protein
LVQFFDRSRIDTVAYNANVTFDVGNDRAVVSGGGLKYLALIGVRQLLRRQIFRFRGSCPRINLDRTSNVLNGGTAPSGRELALTKGAGPRERKNYWNAQ